MASLNVDFYVHMDDIEDILAGFRSLQTYKLDESEELFVSLDDIVGVLRKHLTIDNTRENHRINELNGKENG